MLNNPITGTLSDNFGISIPSSPRTGPKKPKPLPATLAVPQLARDVSQTGDGGAAGNLHAARQFLLGVSEWESWLAWNGDVRACRCSVKADLNPREHTDTESVASPKVKRMRIAAVKSPSSNQHQDKNALSMSFRGDDRHTSGKNAPELSSRSATGGGGRSLADHEKAPGASAGTIASSVGGSLSEAVPYFKDLYKMPGLADANNWLAGVVASGSSVGGGGSVASYLESAHLSSDPTSPRRVAFAEGVRGGAD